MERNILKNRRVLVTGGYGFIGSHLIKRLILEDCKIFILERKNSNPWRIENILNNVKVLEADISSYEEVNKCIENTKPEFVFHLAAYGVDSSKKEYVKAVNTNILGIVNLLSALKKIECKKVVTLGTCAEYGHRTEVMKEDMRLMPVSVYGSTKACSTILAHQIASENNISIVTLRPFGIFGEGEATHKIFTHIILSILKNEDVKLTKCEQYRDYCYVENIVDGILLAAKNNNVKNDIFNIATGEAHKLKFYVELILKHINTSKRPLYGAVPYRKNEMWAPRADVRKIKEVLNWEPKVSLEDGIIRTINWYKNNKYRYN